MSDRQQRGRMTRLHLPLQIVAFVSSLGFIVSFALWIYWSGSHTTFYFVLAIVAAYLGFLSIVILGSRDAWIPRVGWSLFMLAVGTPLRALVSMVFFILGASMCAVLAYNAGYSSPADLVFAVENERQAVPLVGAIPSYEGQPVYCEVVRFRFKASHNMEADIPIRIKGLQLEAERVPLAADASEHLAYRISADDLMGHGIVDVDTYVFTLDAEKTAAVYVVDEDTVVSVQAENLFVREGRATAFTVQTDDNDPIYQAEMAIEASSPGLYRARLKADYDVSGESRTGVTKWLYVAYF